MGIYLGPLPVHSRDTALVMDPATGLVSPQYHVKADPGFNTVTPSRTQMPWKFCAGVAPPPQAEGTSLMDTEATPKRKASSGRECKGRKRRANSTEAEPDNQRHKGKGWPPDPGGTRKDKIAIRTASREGDAPTIMEQFQTIIGAESAVKDVLALKATTDPDTLYYHEAMRAHDRK